MSMIIMIIFMNMTYVLIWMRPSDAGDGSARIRARARPC